MTITCDSPTTHFDSGCELLLHYDKDGDGKISMNELCDNSDSAEKDKDAGMLTGEEFAFVTTAYFEGSIESLCPGCGAEEVIACNNPTTHFGSGCELLLYYDKDGDGKISYAELLTNADSAANAKNAGMITQKEYEFVEMAYQTGSINVQCSGCYAEEAITCNYAVNYPTGCALLLAYDTDGDGIINDPELGVAFTDAIANIITSEEYVFIRESYNLGSINALCSGCYSEDGEAIFRVLEFTAPSSCEVPCNADIHIKWQNVGTIAGSFVPKYEINGIPYTDPQQTLAPNAMYTLDDTVSITSPGTYEICPYPNE